MFEQSLPELLCGGVRELHSAVLEEDTVRLSELLVGGADVDVKDALGSTALRVSITVGNTDIVRALLNSGADVNAKAWFGRSPLHIAVERAEKEKENAEIVRMLLRSGASVNAKDERGLAPIHKAVIKAAVKGDSACLSALLENGADVEATEEKGSTPGRHSISLELLRIQKSFARFFAVGPA